MKKVLFALGLLLFSVIAQSQAPRLDTVYVRSLQLQAQDWAWLAGKYSVPKDSTTAKAVRRLRTTIQTLNPSAWTTNVTVDSLPGSMVMEFYQRTKMAPAGEIAPRYVAIITAISAKTVLSYWIGFVDAGFINEFNRYRNQGKVELLDQ